MLELRPYQTQVVAEVVDAFNAGCPSVCAVVPTGGGKTTLAVEMCRRTLERGGEAIWLAHRHELVDQAKATLERGGAGATEVFTIQALAERKVLPTGRKLVVADECHTVAMATGWQDVVKRLEPQRLLGLTATPSRGDGAGLGAMFQRLVLGPTTKTLTEMGHLVPLEVFAPAAPLRSGTISITPMDAYKEFAEGGKAVVFAPNLRAAAYWAKDFNRFHIPADVIEGELGLARRRDIIESFRDGRLRVLINVAILTEGFDLPDLSCVIVARTVGHPGLLVQMAGRALRASPGKRGAILCDLQGNIHLHGRPDEEFEFQLHGRGMRARSLTAAERYCLICGTIMETNEFGACSFCGITHPELRIPRPMARRVYRWKVVEKMPDDKRVRILARWIREGRAKGWKTGAPFARYRGMFGHSPPPDIVEAAKAASRSVDVAEMAREAKL
jgi:superfamily II DNA or RNA helicase